MISRRQKILTFLLCLPLPFSSPELSTCSSSSIIDLLISSFLEEA
jgi:hypothetical protein